MGLRTVTSRANPKVEITGKVLDDFDYSSDDPLLQCRRNNWTLKSQALFYLIKAAKKFNESAASVKGARKTGNRVQPAVRVAEHDPKQDADLVTVHLNQVEGVSKHLGSKEESHKFAAGSLLFGGLLFVCGAAPWALPGLYLAFAVLSLPYRMYDFCRRKWTFFLLDFCYFANVLTVVFLLWFPRNSHLENVVFAVTDGPLAAAVIVWQCAWVFGSSDHAVSVLIHVLPGLAVFAHRHYITPQGWSGWAGFLTSAALGTASTAAGTAAGAAAGGAGSSAYGAVRFDVLVVSGVQQRVLWLFLLPMAFYLAWQTTYFLLVQVCFRRFILKNDYDTSYNCLARRAAKNNNVWNRMVRRGSVAHRCMMYGLLQLTFTVLSLLFFQPIYHFKSLALVWQVVKVGVSVYYGAQHQCQKVPQRAFIQGVKLLQKQQLVGQQQAACGSDAGGPDVVAATPSAAGMASKHRSRRAAAH